MKPKSSSRIFCIVCKKAKLLFASEQKADNFIRFNAEEIAKENEKAPVRSYYCNACGGWHVTSSPKQRLIRKKKQVRTSENPIPKEPIYDWKKHRTVVDEAVGKVWTARLQYRYDDCYELMERAYLEVEKAEKYGGDEETLRLYRRKLKICGGTLRKAYPRGSQRLNEAFEWLDFEVFRMKTTIPFTQEGYKAYSEQACKIKDGITQALHFGGSVKQLKKYERALEHWLNRYYNNVLEKEYLIEYHYIHPNEKERYRKFSELLLLEQANKQSMI